MATRLSTCSSCSSPIFAEEGVGGACACDVGIYLTLLARQQHENQRGQTRTASTQPRIPMLPELDPMVFLSREARGEVEAAQQSRSPRPVGRPHPITDDPTDGFLDLRLEDAPQTDGFDIEFETEPSEIADYPRYPRGGGGAVQERFRVDRPPVHRPFVAERIPGPQGGPMREAGRAGRFPILREVQVREARSTLSALTDDATALPERPQPTRPTAPEVNARQQAKRAELHRTLPTAYERVARGDFLADADEWD